MKKSMYTSIKGFRVVSTLNSIYLICFFLQYSSTVATVKSSTPYSPRDEIFLDCGSQGKIPAPDGRAWNGDVGSKYAPSEAQPRNPSTVKDAIPADSSVDRVPYLTARISNSSFTYTFPVTAGQKFIRLYFYPAPYADNYTQFNSFFSVRSGPFTLLNNFSAWLAAESLGVKSFFREFCLDVPADNQNLSLTFTSSEKSYAFINGIEIVSMPTNLYYTSGSGLGLPHVGDASRLYIGNDTALEMVYRLNIGGSSISPKDDTGMFRSWSSDYDLQQDGVLPVNTTIPIHYMGTPSYTAPEAVYRTGRSMGTNKTINEGYNLTWMLPVDAGFNYLLRLHFCEFEPEITKVNDRLFDIFINEQKADSVDVIYLAGGHGVPMKSDYIVTVNREGGHDRRNLSVALHPEAEWDTGHSDAILNGLELFKLSNPADHSLAAPNPPLMISLPPPATPQSPTRSPANSKAKTAISFIVAGAVTGALLALLLPSYFIFRRRREAAKMSHSEGGPCPCLWWQDPCKSKSGRTKVSWLPEELCRQFSIAEMRTATNNFDEENIVGEGGFGKVYVGEIDGGETKVAIKRLNPGSKQGAREFRSEVEMLSQLRHLHLVSLIGFCKYKREMILVYDYMPNGTLRDHLYGKGKDPLPWKQRLQICIGAAKGLHYLHAGAHHTIIHRDVKSTNILLDEKLVAKISDFGLSKAGPTTMPDAGITTMVKGTHGYVDPEYVRRGQLTEKSDVYSFGVVLFEVVCAKKVVDFRRGEDQMDLANLVKSCIKKKALDQIIDPYLAGKIAPECLRKFVEVGESCVRGSGNERPPMADVVGGLEFALQLQENAEAAMQDNYPEGSGSGFDLDNIYPEASLFAGTTGLCNGISSVGSECVSDSSTSLTKTLAGTTVSTSSDLHDQHQLSLRGSNK